MFRAFTEGNKVGWLGAGIIVSYSGVDDVFVLLPRSALALCVTELTIRIILYK